MKKFRTQDNYTVTIQTQWRDENITATINVHISIRQQLANLNAAQVRRYMFSIVVWVETL